MKKLLSFILCAVCVLSLASLSACGKKPIPASTTLRFISAPASGYSWHCVISREGVIELHEEFEEDEKSDDNPKGGWQVYTVTAAGAGEVSLDFAYTAPGVEKVELVATYVYVVDENLNLTEKLREGTYFNLDNVVPQNTYVIRLDVDGSGRTWKHEADVTGIIETAENIELDPYALESEEKKGEMVFTLMGMKSGTVEMTFTYSDENGENVKYTAVYKLSVDESLIVSEIEHSGSYFGEDTTSKEEPVDAELTN